MIPAFLLGPLVGKLAEGIFGAIKASGDRQISLASVEAEVKKALAEASVDLAEHQASVIKAEVQSDSWLARNWRPISALCFLWVAMWFGWLQPALYAWGNVPPLKIGDALLLEIIELLKICLGGYIGGRSLEKIAQQFSGKR